MTTLSASTIGKSGPLSACIALLATLLVGCGEEPAANTKDSQSSEDGDDEGDGDGDGDVEDEGDGDGDQEDDQGDGDAPGDGDGDDSDAGPGDGDGGPIEIPELDFAAFDEAVDAYVESKMLKGASAVVVHADYGQVHLQGYGEFDANRVYLIASTSKILSVGVMLRLADQGLVDFDEPVSTYLGEWGEFKTNITLAQMFSNSAGMVSLTDNPVYLPYLCQYTTISGSLNDCAKTIYTANDTVDLKTPDTEFHYGGGQWQLAGGVGTFVSDKTWQELIDETYREPCAATSLGYTNQYQDATLSTLGLGAVAYPAFFSGDPKTLPVTDNPSVEGGAYVAAEDYGKLLLMHLRGGVCGSQRVLSKEAVARMREDRIGEAYDGKTTSDVLEGYGLGWWVDRKHPGVVVDPGAYGAVSYLDENRKYAVFIAVESGSGTELFETTKPTLDEIFP
jgi:CubicO group peptidase (beta-lactamase class C family)